MLDLDQAKLLVAILVCVSFQLLVLERHSLAHSSPGQPFLASPACPLPTSRSV